MAGKNYEKQGGGERSVRTPLNILEGDVLNNNPKDINLSTKINLLNEKLKNLKKQKLKTKDKLEKTNIQEEINSIVREKNRIVRFHIVSKNKVNGIDNLEKEDIDSISAKKLLQIEKEKTGFLSSAFAYKQTKDVEGNITEEPLTNLGDIKEGDKILIDFGKNAGAYWKVGAGDILPKNIKVVKIIDKNGNERVGTREISGNKVGYYDENNKYIPIFNGYSIYIPTLEELKKSEYSHFGVKSIFASEVELKEMGDAEEKAKDKYVKELEMMGKLDLVKETVFKISTEVGDIKPYKNKINAMLTKAGEYLKKKDFSKYSEESLNLVIARLNKTKDILGDKDFDFDWDKYKEVIASHESGGSYFARNDNLGKKRGISSEKWAFGKYQFITQTLRGYGVDLGRPPEEDKINKFLSNSSLQEEIMDKYMLDLLEKHIIPSQKIMSSITSNAHSIPFFLALGHIGGPGAIKNQSGSSDWLGTSTTSYASWVEARV